MEKIHCSIHIEAPNEKVWHTMLDDATYREWTRVFSEGSYFEGDWSEGSKILFLSDTESPDGTSGMVSRVAINRPYEFISIEHLGIMKNGVEDTTSMEAKKWTPAFENYTFIEKENGTEVVVDMDIEAEQKEAFEKMWSEALQKLKTLAEA